MCLTPAAAKAGWGPNWLRGHEVTGVDADAQLIGAARAGFPAPRWIVADLTDFDLSGHGDPEPFDGAVMAGNVMLFVVEGTQPEVLRRVAAHLRPGGFAAIGFAAGRGYELPDFDQHAAAAGLVRAGSRPGGGVGGGSGVLCRWAGPAVPGLTRRAEWGCIRPASAVLLSAPHREYPQ